MPTPRTLFEGREVGGFRFSTPLEQKLLRKMTRAVDEFDMLADGDRIMVCVSGGKDSYALLDLLRLAQRRSPVRFELLALNVDQGWPGYATDVIEGHLRREGVKYRMLTENYARIVEAKLEPGQTPCVLCSRFRRGFLYKLAPELGCNKIALGHHADDLCETLVMNMFYSGRLGTMPPKLHSSDGRNTVIRPMAFIMEQEVRGLCDPPGIPPGALRLPVMRPARPKAPGGQAIADPGVRKRPGHQAPDAGCHEKRAPFPAAGLEPRRPLNSGGTA